MSTGELGERLRQLLEKQHWREEERRWLLHYLDTTDQAGLRQLMQETFDNDAALHQADATAERMLLLIHQKIKAKKSKGTLLFFKSRKHIRAAAAVLFIVSIGALAYTYYAPEKENARAIIQNRPAPQDIAPGRNAAVLTLSDGSTIVLDDAVNGTLAQQGNVKVLKLNGQVAYKGNGSRAGEVVYNTVTTSRGNQYQLVLADGSSVWLNAASSIRFPIAFTGTARRVEITGEAYFEVAPLYAKGAQKVPFVVSVNTASGGGYEVQVLGTHFNINAYDDEPAVRTTLVEGKVRVMQDSRSVLLQPAQQAVSGNGNKALAVQPADVDEALAWKMGLFEFHEASLYSVMRQLSRWYDVDVRFSGSVPDKLYNGSIRRQATLSQVLQILKLAGVRYSLRGRIVTIGAD